MRILGLFNLRDVTRERLVFKNIDSQELVKRLNVMTDGSTNVGFLTGTKKFHGLVGQEKFRLRTVRRSIYNHITVSGAIKRDEHNLIVDIEYERNVFMVLLPTIFLILATILVLQVASAGHFGLGFYLVACFFVGVILFLLEYKRDEELAETQGQFHSLYRSGE